MNRRAFSLTDLLAVVCLAVLGLAVLVPAMKRNRDVSLFQVSQARLGANAQAHLQYAANDGGRFVARLRGTDTGFLRWFQVPTPSGYWSFDAGAQPWVGEFLGGHQWWALQLSSTFADQRSPVQCSPCDAPVMRRIKNLGESPDASYPWSIDSSYWMTPTIWFSNARYLPSLTTRSPAAASDVRRSSVSDIVFPTEKCFSLSASHSLTVWAIALRRRSSSHALRAGPMLPWPTGACGSNRCPQSKPWPIQQTARSSASSDPADVGLPTGTPSRGLTSTPMALKRRRFRLGPISGLRATDSPGETLIAPGLHARSRASD